MSCFPGCSFESGDCIGLRSGCFPGCPFESKDCKNMGRQEEIAKDWHGKRSRELYVTGGLLIRIKEMIEKNSDVPSNILGYINKITALKNGWCRLHFNFILS